MVEEMLEGRADVAVRNLKRAEAEAVADREDADVSLTVARGKDPAGAIENGRLVAHRPFVDGRVEVDTV